MRAIVTIKLKKNPKHNPHCKIESVCPVSIDSTIHHCTDSTGEHHSVLIEGNDITDIENKIRSKGYNHITRVEVIEY